MLAQKKIQPEKTVTSTSTPAAISVCDIIHANANNVIEKMESLLPANMQMYSDFYTEYLHSLQDLFGACYIAENEVLSRLGLSQKVLQSFGNYTKAITESTITQIEIANNVQKTFLQNQISAIKTSDEYIHLMLDYYSKMLTGSLNILKKS